MIFNGYRLVGTSKSMPSGYIPSLIGITPEQVEPSGTDTYFEQVALPPDAVNLTSVSYTRWVSYDSLPLNERDPILAVKAGTLGYYIPLSELRELLNEHGSTDSRLLLAGLRKGQR